MGWWEGSEGWEDGESVEWWEVCSVVWVGGWFVVLEDGCHSVGDQEGHGALGETCVIRA